MATLPLTTVYSANDWIHYNIILLCDHPHELPIHTHKHSQTLTSTDIYSQTFTQALINYQIHSRKLPHNHKHGYIFAHAHTHKQARKRTHTHTSTRPTSII